MTSEIICSLIALGGVLASAIISYAIARSTANGELKKMKLTWEREDVVSSDDEFAEMSSAVARYIQTHTTSAQHTAIEKVSAVRSKETGTLGAILDDLYHCIRVNDAFAADMLLSKVIDQKRETKSKTNAPKRNKPKK